MAESGDSGEDHRGLNVRQYESFVGAPLWDRHDALHPLSAENQAVKRSRVGISGLLLAVGTLAVGSAAADDGMQFDANEIARIIALGPWPPAFERDPSNRVSGMPAAIDFGRRLFFEPRFSPNGYISCVACHQPDRSFTDSLPRARGLAPVERNAPALHNLRLQRWYGWGGSSDSLWMASLRPILDEREIGGSAAKVARVIRTGDGVACRYRAAFGTDPARENAETVLVNVGKALAAYEETLRTGRTAFDDFRDGVARGERGARTYPIAAQGGLKIFVGRGNCFTCHSGPNFTDGEFRATGVPLFAGQRAPDTGREAGVRAWRESGFHLSGRYNDDAARSTATPARHVRPGLSDRGKWRTPSLRNVAVTAPYLHNGGAVSLREVVRRYAQLDEDQVHTNGERGLHQVELSERDVDDLIAFLETLTDDDGARRRLAPLVASACD